MTDKDFFGDLREDRDDVNMEVDRDSFNDAFQVDEPKEKSFRNTPSTH